MQELKLLLETNTQYVTKSTPSKYTLVKHINTINHLYFTYSPLYEHKPKRNQQALSLEFPQNSSYIYV